MMMLQLAGFVLLIFSLSVFARDTTPSQIHIALAGSNSDGSANGMAISWHTESETVTSTVKYREKSGLYTSVATGSGSIYYKTIHHHVVLSGLSPLTTYYYVVGDPAGGWSKEYQFKSAPLTADLRSNFSFIVFGDLGVYNGDPTNEYLKSIKDDVQLVWHSGDIGYADDSFLHLNCVVNFCYEDTYNTYMEGIEEWASKVPYMVAAGNHEAECHDPSCLLDRVRRERIANFSSYNTRFRMPSPESNGALNMHYSFNYGSVHFITIDTETGFPDAPEETRYVLPCGGFADQLSWLENDLIQATKDRSLRPWILVTGHHPMYSGNSVFEAFQTAMEDLFYKYGVDAYFSGHVHSYERDYPVYQSVVDANGYSNPTATTHFLIGGAGYDEMHGIQSAINEVSKVFTHAMTTFQKWTHANPPDLSRDFSPKDNAVYRKLSAKDMTTGSITAVTDKDNHVGIGKVTIIDDSHMQVDYIRTTTGEIFDTVLLYRDHSSYMVKSN